MLPKPLYEGVPYLFLIVGGVVVVLLGGYAAPAGILLYMLGAWQWVVRSDYRRLNERRPRNSGSRFYWGETLYEFLPFVYILLGLVMLGHLQHEVRLVFGPLVILVGLALWLMRADHRSRPPVTLQLREVKPQVASKQPAWHRSKNSLEAVNDGVAQAQEELSRTAQCDRCQIEQICQSVNLDIRSVQQIMRLSQTVSPDQAFEHFRAVVEPIEGRSVSNEELQAVLNLLCGYSDFCATWSKRSSSAESASVVG